MTLEERHDLRIVLKALHVASCRGDARGEPEQRGRAYGPPEWHEGFELWTRALAVSDADPIAFDAVWAALVEQSTRYLQETRTIE